MKNLILLMAIMFSSQVFACKCHQYNSEKSKFSDSGIIMLVKGLNKSTLVESKLLSEFEVIESFKGPAKKGQILKIDTRSDTSCAGPTESKYIHLLYAYKEDDNYAVTRCGTELFEKVKHNDDWYGLSKSEVDKRIETLKKLANDA